MKEQSPLFDLNGSDPVKAVQPEAMHMVYLVVKDLLEMMPCFGNDHSKWEMD